MSAVVSEMLIRIAADTAQLRSEMEQAKRTVGNGFDGIKGAASSLKSALTGLLAGIGAAALAKEFVQTADAMAQLDARLKNAVGSGADFAKAQADIYRISQANNIGLQEATTLYTKMHEPVKRLGGGTKETAAIVESFALSLRLGGASTQEASSATLQFAQAMGSGKLQGDEFRSMAEASPRFMKALAEGMGVPIETLKTMGSEGKLTSDVVGNALVKALGKLKSEAGNLPDTVGGAFQRIKNDVMVAVNELNQNSNLTLGIAGLSEAVRELIPDIKIELAGAFEAVGDFISRNKEGVAEVWAVAKSLGADVWELVKAFGRVLAFVGDVLVKSGALKTAFEAVRLIVAALQDGMEIVVATFQIMGAQILKVLGIFSSAAADAARKAEEAGLAVYKRFANGGSNVQQLNAELLQTAKNSDQVKLALAGSTNSVSDNTREMNRLRESAVATNTGFVSLKSSATGLTDEQKKLTDEQKKADTAYQKLINSIHDKTGAMLLEQQGGEKLTDGQKTALKVMQDIQSGTLKLTDEKKRALVVALEEMLATERATALDRAAIAAKEDMRKARQKATEEAVKEAQAINDSVAKQIEENLQVGKSKAQLAQMETQRLADRLAIMQQIVAQEELIGICNAETEAHKESRDALQALIAAKGMNIQANNLAAMNLHIQTIKDSTAAQLTQNAAIGKTTEELNKEEIARLQAKAASLQALVTNEELNDIYNEEAQAHRDTLKALKDLIAAKEQGIHVQSAQEATAAWKQTATDIGKGLTDAFMDAFTSGKDIFTSLRDLVTGMFKDMVLRPVIQAAMNPIAQGITGMLGLSGSASAGSAGGGMSGLSSIGSMVSGAGMFGNGFMSGLTAWGEGGSVMGLLGQGSSLFSGGMASGLGTIAGALGPIALGAAALFALADSFKGETRAGGQYGYNFGGGVANNRRGTFNPNAALGVNFLEGPSGGQIAAKEVTQSIQSTVNGINSLLSGLGSSKQLIGFQAGLETSDKGRGGVFAGGTLTGGIRFGESGQGDNYAGTLFESTSSKSLNSEQAVAAFALDLQQSTIQAIQSAADIPRSIKDMLAGIDAESLTMEVATSLVSAVEKTVAGVGRLRDAINYMPMANLANMSFEAANALIELSGGVENLLGGLNNYIAEYYSQEEQLGMQAATISQALTLLGIDPKTINNKDEFRALVESIDVSKTTGQQQLAALLAIGPQFANIAEYLEQNEMTMAELLENAPATNIMSQMLTPAETTAAATTSLAEKAETGNAILVQINNNIVSMTAATNAAVSAAVSASNAAAAAAAAAALISSAPNYTYNPSENDGGSGRN